MHCITCQQNVVCKKAYKTKWLFIISTDCDCSFYREGQ